MSVLISGVDLLGRAMDLEYLYPVWLKWRASNVTAVCNLFAVAAIGCATRARHSRPWQTRLSPEDTIVWISGGCVVLAGLGATVTAFILQIEDAGTTFGITRAQALSSYAEEFDQALTARIENPRLVVAALRVQDVLRHPADNGVRLRGLAALNAFRDHGYSYLALRTLAGETVLKLGAEIAQPELAIRLQAGRAPERSTLQWVHGFSMRTETPVMADGTQVGWLVAEHPLAHMTSRYTGTRDLGITETLAISGLDAHGRLMSFPQRFDAYVFELPAWMPEHRPLPSRLAVTGQTGYGQWRDIHGIPTAFGYTPIGHTGLALISKIASAELYAPMRQQFERLGSFILCMMIGSVLAIRVTVQPFANRLAAWNGRCARPTRTSNAAAMRCAPAANSCAWWPTTCPPSSATSIPATSCASPAAPCRRPSAAPRPTCWTAPCASSTHPTTTAPCCPT